MMDHNAERLVKARKLLEPVHSVYTSTVSSQGMALSLETAALTWVLCDLVRPSSIIDMGSGFSSYVIREWVKQSGSGAICTSVDDDEQWLKLAQKFCVDQGQAGADGFETLASFKERREKTYDLVVYDLGRMQARSQNLERGLDARANNGVIIIDDMHKFNYHKEVVAALDKHGLVGVDMKDVTTDVHEGRHCWLGVASNGMAASIIERLMPATTS